MSMQPTFEEWVQTLTLQECDEQLLWRQEKYTALKQRLILPSYPGERQQLEREIYILEKRYHLLESDNNCTLEQVEQLLTFLDYLEEKHEEGRIDFREVNLSQIQERRKRLFARRDELTKEN